MTKQSFSNVTKSQGELAQLDKRLHSAVRQNNIPEVEKILDAGAKIDYMYCSVYSALMEAVSDGFYEMAEMLIKRGADVNLEAYESDKTTLYFAVKGKNEKMFQLLLSNGLKLDSRALIQAIEDNNRPFFDKLLEMKDVKEYIQNQNKAEKDNKLKKSPLFYASQYPKASDYIYYINKLLDLGAEINTRENMIGSVHPLINVVGENYDLTKRMLELGADPNVVEGFYNQTTPLIKAVKFGDLKTIKLLLDHGANRNLIVEEDEMRRKDTTALSVAAVLGNTEILTFLNTYTPNKELKNESIVPYESVIDASTQSLAVRDAIQHGRIDSLNFFGDRALIQEKNPNSLLVLAVKYSKGNKGSDYLSVIKKLLTVAKADPNAYEEISNFDTGKKTKIFAVQHAALNNRFDLCKELIDGGARVEALPDSIHILMEIIDHNNKKMMKLFLENGAPVEIPGGTCSDNMLIPLAYAMKMKREDLLPDLAEYTAKANVAPEYLEKVLNYTDGIDEDILNVVKKAFLRKTEYSKQEVKQEPKAIVLGREHIYPQQLLLEKKIRTR